MVNRLVGKTALITGGGTGIGRETAILFAKEGAAVAVCGRRAEKLSDTREKISLAGGRCEVLVGDIGEEPDATNIVAETIRRLGRLDILVNNASVVGQVAPVQELDLGQWEECLRINLTGAVLCSREALKHMIGQRSGCIINVSSIVSRRGYKNRAPYVCSKWALNSFSQTLAKEVGQYGIRVNTVCPGPVMTERLQSSIKRQAAARGITVMELEDEWSAESPMNRLATVDECVRIILFLACEDSSGMTGQALDVSVGAVMT